MSEQSANIMQGYLLKKKRKKLQGMAKRYFTLSNTGALSYSFNPTSTIRDSILISSAYVSASRKERSFHIDSGRTIMYCKALTEGDFDKWTTAFKGFVGTVVQEEQSNKKSNSSHSQNHHHNTIINSSGSTSTDLINIFNAVAKMIAPLQDLETIHSELKSQPIPSEVYHHSVTSPTSTTSSSISSSQNSSLHTNNSTSTSPLKFLSSSSSKRRAKSNAAELLSSSSYNNPTSPSANSTGEYFDLKPIPPPLPSSNSSITSNSNQSNGNGINNELLIKNFGLALEKLKLQHEILMNSLNELPRTTSPRTSQLDGGNNSSTNTQSQTKSNPNSNSKIDGSTSTTSLSLFTNLSNLNFNHPNSNSSSTSPSSIYGTPRPSLSRASSFSVNSSETENDFYVDAMNMPVGGEFVMEEEEEGGTDSSGDEEGEDGDRTTFSNFDDSTVSEEEETEKEELEGNKKKVDTSGIELLNSIKRRTKLPAPVSGDEFSMLSMLRKNVGKDLSTISFPVTINEPLSALQRIAEDFEFSNLLTRAAVPGIDPVERMALVASFVVAGSSSNKFRSSRKPFNPLLGETYELIRPEPNYQFKFLAEKVSHHPPIMAFYAESFSSPSSTESGVGGEVGVREGNGNGWKVEGFIAPSQKFWGRSMEILVSGDYKITFFDTGEIFSIRKPSTFVRNLVAGTKYLEIIGDLLITTSSPPSSTSPTSSTSFSSTSPSTPSNLSAQITYKEGSTFGGASSRNKVEGKILDSTGRVKGELVGRWDESLDFTKSAGGGGEGVFKRLWKVGEWGEDPTKYYGFSPFSITLNELPPPLPSLSSLSSPSSSTSPNPAIFNIAPTDSRLRPDQQALERGNIEEAEIIKKRVEEKQRSKRSAATGESGGGEGGNGGMWFEKKGEGWGVREGGRYFKVKESNSFEDPDIF